MSALLCNCLVQSFEKRQLQIWHRCIDQLRGKPAFQIGIDDVNDLGLVRVPAHKSPWPAEKIHLKEGRVYIISH